MGGNVAKVDCGECGREFMVDLELRESYCPWCFGQMLDLEDEIGWVSN